MIMDQITHSTDRPIFIRNFSKMTCGRLLDLVQPEVDPHDPPTPKNSTLVPNMWIVHLFAILK